MPVLKKPAPRPRRPFAEITESRKGPLNVALADFYDEHGRWVKRKSKVTVGGRLVERRKHTVDKEGPKYIQDVYSDKGKLIGSIITQREPAFDLNRGEDRFHLEVKDKRRGQIRTIDAIHKGKFEDVNIAHLNEWLSAEILDMPIFDRPIFDKPDFARNLATALTRAPYFFFENFSDARMEEFARYVAEHKYEFMSGISKNPDGFWNSLHKHKYAFAKNLERFLLEGHIERDNALMIAFKLSGVNMAGEGRLAPAIRRSMRQEEIDKQARANAEQRRLLQEAERAVVIKPPSKQPKK